MPISLASYGIYGSEERHTAVPTLTYDNVPRYCNWRLRVQVPSGMSHWQALNFQPSWLWLGFRSEDCRVVKQLLLLLLLLLLPNVCSSQLPRTNRFGLHPHQSQSRLSLRLTTCTVQLCQNRVPLCLLRGIYRAWFVWFAVLSLGCKMADNQYRKQYE